MKKTILALPLALGLTAAAQAGEVMTAKEVIPPPDPCRLQWFLGASGGYLTDAEEEMYHLQFGAEKWCPTHSHALYLEVGYTEFDNDYDVEDRQQVFPAPGLYDLDVEIIPVTLNYKYERSFSNNLGWYIGAGAGIAFVDMDLEGLSVDDSYDDEVFYAQVFTGLTYNFSESFEIFGGVRYIFMDDPDLTGNSDVDDNASIDEDLLVELGLRWNF
ncbi:hypothetical protein Rhal01_03802 [Rubritalea halochordaticola]|uniref:Porin family protein n=1 Tax=Rubritalea halochordaticola TaxID=714537 RepID=A0ABP9V4L7_9BACT